MADDQPPSTSRRPRVMAVTLLAAAAVALALAAWLRPLDDLAQAQASAGFKRALAAFATARAINAAVSVLQGTQVGAGVGVTVNTAPGEVLDPINDLVEQFSALMLGASIAFGAQIVLMKIGAGWLVSLALTVLLLAWWWTWRAGRSPPLLQKALLVLLLVRFALPVATVGSDLAFRAFLQDDWRVSSEGAGAVASALGAQQQATTPESRVPWWNVRERYEQVRAAGEGLVNHVIWLAVVFLVQTLVLPFLWLWLMVRLARRLI